MAKSQSALKKMTLHEVWVSTRFTKSGNIVMPPIISLFEPDSDLQERHKNSESSD
jgi:hypothetical protein